ncbi:PQQ-binding-like beta-propeller repeat protein [Streptomyces sp. NK15101]|uniref:outer membrane protein assembly factor BamB family protein n=1 Tax=Streptomyces sp. NK15101 TaxID=2873261 RepID=UPI001CECCCD1|nr:PQQ-binding-like beta-propeller repeat protein [Streptomyces sp. NK15101]
MTWRTNDARAVRPESAGRWHTALALTVVAAIALAFIAGLVYLVLPGYMPFNAMTTVWEAPHDGEAAEGGNDTWLVGDIVVRSRVDGATAFDVRSGKKRWEYLVPDRAETCGSGADIAVGVALIAFREARPQEKGCVTVVAVDLADGRELWRTTGVSAAFLDDVVTTGGGLGVLLDGGRLRAVDLRTGAPRWTAPLSKGCDPRGLGLAPKQVVVALMCGTGAVVAAFDPVNGRTRWTVPVDARRGVDADAELSVVSADPPTVRVHETDGDGPGAVLAFGPDGRARSRIDAVGDYGQIFTAVVEDGRLFALTGSGRGQSGPFGGIVAFDLATGGELWRKAGGGSAFDVADGRVTVVRPSYKNGDLMFVIDAATGDEEDERAFRDRVAGAGDVLTHQDLVVVVGGSAGHAFTVYERW